MLKVGGLPNGIFHLLINTKDKWMDFYAYNDTEFLIGEDVEDIEELKLRMLYIPKFLPKNIRFIQTEMQDKDQISFYWIPYTKDYIKNRNIILSSNERENN